jgi:hypothetical protein
VTLKPNPAETPEVVTIGPASRTLKLSTTQTQYLFDKGVLEGIRAGNVRLPFAFSVEALRQARDAKAGR